MTEAGPVPQRGSGPVFSGAADAGRRRRARGVWRSRAADRHLRIQRVRHVSAPAPSRGIAGARGGDRRRSALARSRTARGSRRGICRRQRHPPCSADDLRAWQRRAHRHARRRFATLRCAPASACCWSNIPGTAGPTGKPSEASRHRGARRRVRLGDGATARSTRARIIGYGRSLGGGAIAQLAARRPLAALVLESTFDNFDEVVTAYGVPRWLLINQFDTRAVLARYAGRCWSCTAHATGTFPMRATRSAAGSRRAPCNAAPRNLRPQRLPARNGSWYSVSWPRTAYVANRLRRAAHEQHHLLLEPASCIAAAGARWFARRMRPRRNRRRRRAPRPQRPPNRQAGQGESKRKCSATSKRRSRRRRTRATSRSRPQ